MRRASSDPIVENASSLDVEQSIPGCFDQIVATRPHSKAVVGSAWEPTYAELCAASNSIAQAICRRGGAAGDRIAVLMRHDAPQMAAVLSILKTGRVVVVLNPSDPPARLVQLLEDAEPHLLLTDAANQSLGEQIELEPNQVVPWEPSFDGSVADDPHLRVDPKEVAFLVYTSGTTGRPKGIMQTHRNILHNVRRLSRGLQLTPDDRIMLPASLSGAHGVATLWCALMNGAVLLPFPAMERGVTGLAEWIRDNRISVLVASASLFRHFAKTLDQTTRFPDVRIVRLGSEPATAEDFRIFQRHFGRDCVLFHTLSSSETGNMTQARYDHESVVTEGRLPVGRPAEGIDVLLLDETGAEVDAGQAGEIIVQSPYLSPGYWRNPQLTASRFAAVNGSAGLRQYRTGDLGRFVGAGRLMFLGRKDGQVKVHGYRIELSEVEDALMRLPEVDKAAVSSQISANADARLVAGVVLKSGEKATAESLRQGLRGLVPNYMVPATFVFWDALPLTPHGKIDREKLRQLRVEAMAPLTGEAPLTEAEILLARIWSEQFQRDGMVRQSDFFDLGGDSLSAAVVAARIHSELKVELDLRRFITHSRLAELAGEIERLQRESAAVRDAPFVRMSRESALPLSFAQERIWMHSRDARGPTGYTVACSHRIRGPLRVDLLRDCLDYLHRRHEVLRTTFGEVNGVATQIVHPAEPVSLPLTDLCNAPDAEEQAIGLFREEARYPFELARLPLLRFHLLRLGEDEHWLIRVNHHIISDGWSWRVFFRELAQLYEAGLRGEPRPLPECEALQYADYAAWQRRNLRPQGSAYQETVQWWAGRFAGKTRCTPPPVRRLKKARNAKPGDGFIWWGLDRAITTRLDRFGRSAGFTYYSIRLAAFGAVLAEECRESDVLVGTYVTNRTRVESQNMFGFFSNLAMLRLRFDRDQSFTEWLRVVQEQVAEVQAHGEIPFEQLCDESLQRKVRIPDLKALFTVTDNSAPVRFGGLELSWLDRRMEVMPWGFTLTFDQHNETNHCRVVFDATLYDPAKVRRFVARLVRFLGSVAAEPDVPMAGPLLATENRGWLERFLGR